MKNFKRMLCCLFLVTCVVSQSVSASVLHIPKKETINTFNGIEYKTIVLEDNSRIRKVKTTSEGEYVIAIFDKINNTMTYEENNNVTSQLDLNNQYKASSSKINLMSSGTYSLKDIWFGFGYYDSDTTNDDCMIYRGSISVFDIYEDSSYVVNRRDSDVQTYYSKLLALKKDQIAFEGMLQGALLSGAISVITSERTIKKVVAGLIALGLLTIAVNKGHSIWVQGSSVSYSYDIAVY